MTVAKRLIEIKKELRKVRKRMNMYVEKSNNPNICLWEDVEEYCFPNNVYNYDIITKDGTKYILNNLNCIFPNIDFKDIVFVEKNMYTAGGYRRKKDNKLIHITNKYEAYNTLIGYTDTYNYKRIQDMEKKYNVKKIVGEYPD